MHCLVVKPVGGEKEVRQTTGDSKDRSDWRGVNISCLGRYTFFSKVLACSDQIARIGSVPDFLSLGVALVLTFPRGRKILAQAPIHP
jgi:hypothetical protein